MTSVTIQLSTEEILALKERTGKRTVGAALKAWVANADAQYTVRQLQSALAESAKQEAEGKGRRCKSGREAMRWLAS